MDSDQPSAKRKGRAAIFVVSVVLAVIVLVFVGRNIWHAEEQQEDETTGQVQHEGLD